MSDHWEVYQCTIGEFPAFILYDHGVRTTINELPIVSAVRIRARFHDPKPNGLPTSEESEVLLALEDDLVGYFTEKRGLPIGRVTVDGARHFIYYADLPEQELSASLKNLGNKHGYKLAFSSMEDPERKAYWEDLFPTEHDWQVMQDIKVIEGLGKAGDSLSRERDIDHWVYFRTERTREEFCAWALKNGYSLQEHHNKADGEFPFGIHLVRACVPRLPDISEHTLQLFDEAKQHDGYYDGWGTVVVKE